MWANVQVFARYLCKLLLYTPPAGSLASSCLYIFAEVQPNPRGSLAPCIAHLTKKGRRQGSGSRLGGELSSCRFDGEGSRCTSRRTSLTSPLVQPPSRETTCNAATTSACESRRFNHFARLSGVCPKVLDCLTSAPIHRSNLTICGSLHCTALWRGYVATGDHLCAARTCRYPSAARKAFAFSRLSLSFLASAADARAFCSISWSCLRFSACRRCSSDLSSANRASSSVRLLASASSSSRRRSFSRRIAMSSASCFLLRSSSIRCFSASISCSSRRRPWASTSARRRSARRASSKRRRASASLAMRSRWAWSSDSMDCRCSVARAKAVDWSSTSSGSSDSSTAKASSTRSLGSSFMSLDAPTPKAISDSSDRPKSAGTVRARGGMAWAITSFSVTSTASSTMSSAGCISSAPTSRPSGT
mmetsp:Transcript_56915/g.133068  ORF Transcript_56915/g.133068 Transcript_56915/m.133068 type:complete len:419 (-) Transcript_56915:592-1848(-)